MDKDTEIQARLKLWSNFELYSKHCLKIQTEGTGDLIPFVLNDVQIVLQQIIKEIKSKNRLVRLVILKARREGISTWATGRFYWKTSTNKNRYAMLVTHDTESKDFLFGIIKRYHAHCPPEFKPEDKYNNRAILEFNNASGTGLDSAVRVACAGKEDLGSSMKIDFLHLSELSKWERPIITPLLTSVLQTVPNDMSSEIIIESTAKGVGGEFYNRFWNARYFYDVKLTPNGEIVFNEEIRPNSSADNEYTAIFFPFFVDKRYQKPIENPEEFVLTEEEKELKALYHLTDEQLNWRRWTIENKCNGDVNVFKQEYPSNPRECFLSSGFSVFDTTKLLQLMELVKDPVIKYEIQTSNLEFLSDKKGRFWVWKEPIPDRKYIVSADISEGLEGDNRDFTSIDVIDRITGEQVATWHGKISPDLVADILYAIGRRYNKALLVPERNNHGMIVINKLIENGYPDIYVEMQENPPFKSRKRFGWLTRQNNKPQIIDNLIQELRENTIGINNRYTLEEMLTFKQDDSGKLGAEEGHFDDRVMSLAIGKFVNKVLPVFSTKKQNFIKSQNQNYDKNIKYSSWG